jgi:phosphoribosylglycinamide formyltransferase-1
MSLRIAVFASGGGSNLQALIDRFNKTSSEVARITLVLSDHAEAGALSRARRAGIDAAHIAYASRPADYVAHEILTALQSADIDLVALAGYLRLVPSAIVRRYKARMLNVHPALLPAFGGKGMYGRRVHEAVLANGCGVSGATVHYVDEQYDEGHIVAQWPVPVLVGDTAETLAARVLAVEHMLYPAALELVAHHIATGQAGCASAAMQGASFKNLSQSAPDEAELRRSLGIE